jgi:hypothetical protein
MCGKSVPVQRLAGFSTPIFAARNLPTIRARRPRFFREIPPLLVGRFLGPDGIAGPPGIEGLDRPRPTGGSFSPGFKDSAAFPRHRTLDPSAPINTIGGQASTGNRPTSWGPDRGRLTLPALLPRTHRHPPPPLRSAPRLLHRTASPEGHRPAIRLQLPHAARRDLRLSHAVSSRPSSPFSRHHDRGDRDTTIRPRPPDRKLRRWRIVGSWTSPRDAP